MAPRAKAKAKPAFESTEVECQRCGRSYVASWKPKDGPPKRFVCGARRCQSVEYWTDEEWRLRALLAAKRPPVKPGDRLGWRVYGFCRNGCDAALDVFAVGCAPSGVMRVAACCTKCRTVLRDADGDLRVWDDNPLQDITAASGDVGRWLDAEALRRFPGARDEVAALWAAAAERDAETAERRPVAKAAALRSAPVVADPCCLIAEADAKGWKAKCGRTVKRAGRVAFLPDARMTGWDFQVTCPACRATMDRADG